MNFDSTRRRFLAAGSCAAAALMLPTDAPAAQVLPIGLGLFTLMAELERDLPGTFKAIAAMGYREVEISIFDKPPAKLVRSLLDEFGLTATSTHLTPSRIEQDMEFANVVGSSFVVVPGPGVPDPSRLRPANNTPEALGAAFAKMLETYSLSDWQWNAADLNLLGMLAMSNGLRFAYHTHGNDFARYGADLAFDVTLRDTDPALVGIELDIGWAVNAGMDPVALLEQHGARIRMLHVKDVAKGFVPSTGARINSPAVGLGVVDWPSVLASAKQQSVRHCYVEVEPPYGGMSAMQAARASREYLVRVRE